MCLETADDTPIQIVDLAMSIAELDVDLIPVDIDRVNIRAAVESANDLAIAFVNCDLTAINLCYHFLHPSEALASYAQEDRGRRLPAQFV